jgi:hypothetical protein
MRIRNFIICLMLWAAISLASGSDARAQTLVEADGVNVAESLAGARLRNFNGVIQNAFLGIPDLGEADRRVETNLQWAPVNELTWRLDPVQDQLSLTVANANGSWTLFYNNWLSNVDALSSGTYHQADLNTLILDIWNRDDATDALLTLSDVRLDGELMGSFSAAHGLAPPRERRAIIDHCFGEADGFELTATLTLANLTTSQAELNRVDLRAGVDPSMGISCAQPSSTSIQADPLQSRLFRGEELVVTVTLSNQGAGTAREVVVQLSEPEGLTMTDALAACGSEEPGVSSCPIGDISPDDQFSFQFTIQADEEAVFGTREFEVSYSSLSLDLFPIKSATVNVTIANDADAMFSDRFQQ